MKSLYTILSQLVLARSKSCSEKCRKYNNVQKVEKMNGKDIRMKRVNHVMVCGNKMPTRCNRGFYCRSYCLLNMFWAPLCPSSGAQVYYTVVAACGISCCGFQVDGLLWSWGLCVRFAGSHCDAYRSRWKKIPSLTAVLDYVYCLCVIKTLSSIVVIDCILFVCAWLLLCTEFKYLWNWNVCKRWWKMCLQLDLKV